MRLSSGLKGMSGVDFGSGNSSSTVKSVGVVEGVGGFTFVFLRVLALTLKRSAMTLFWRAAVGFGLPRAAKDVLRPVLAVGAGFALPNLSNMAAFLSSAFFSSSVNEVRRETGRLPELRREMGDAREDKPPSEGIGLFPDMRSNDVLEEMEKEEGSLALSWDVTSRLLGGFGGGTGEGSVSFTRAASSAAPSSGGGRCISSITLLTRQNRNSKLAVYIRRKAKHVFCLMAN